MFRAVVLVGLLVSQVSFAAPYPKGPVLSVTPGSLCENSSTRRYPEKVKYCNRNVDSTLKYEIIAYYEKELGFGIMEHGRENFKIDHLIPLCAGGSNNRDNLWPQHRSVYERTDVLEQPLCEKMAAGKLSQAHAVKLILKAKSDLTQVEDVEDELNSL